MSSLYAPTLKEVPGEAEIASHRLLLRAGMMRRLAAGVYTYLPLAWRSLKKVEEIVRDEMDAIGAQELLMPILQPAELWHESGRWNDYGPELMRLKDRHDRDFCLGPTHEEVMTTLVRNELRSYRQLPVTLYQIQSKYRDEIRPRFGLLRGREFIMKDGYSFHTSEESLHETYTDMECAYGRVCERLGLDYRVVDADSGEIGGSETVEFMALADAGEAEILFCEGYAADKEAAYAIPEITEITRDQMEEVHTPGAHTIAALAQFLDIPESATVKALALIDGEKKPVVCFIPGDHELNGIKVNAHVEGDWSLMTDEDLVAHGLVKGFMGPVGLPAEVSVLVDKSLESITQWVCGANKVDYHFVGARVGVDFETPTYVDLIEAQAGDKHPESGLPLESARGIEVSQIFKLGTKYSTALNATYTDEDGTDKPFIMGCYGIGVSRSLAAVVEQHNDEYGITWPISVAPYEVSVVPLTVGDDKVAPVAQRIADELAAAGVEVVLDDRNERPGVKFADNDLMGFPFQVVCGKRGIDEGVAEVKIRATGEKRSIALDKVASEVVVLVREAHAALGNS